MIAALNGVVSEKLISTVVIDINGVGYGVYVTAEDYGHLNVAKDTKLYIYEHVREQSHDLFGFLSRDTQDLFEKLLEVNGIGPKMALNMLSTGSSGEVRKAIADGNVAFLQQANGVGKRVAQRVVVELKDKVGLTGVDLDDTDLLKGSGLGSNDEALEALLALGYAPSDAVKALKDVDPKLPTGERVKNALKGVAKS